MSEAEQSSEIPPQPHRKVINATCTTHGGPVGFTNVVMRKLDGEIELDPHATGACVIRLSQDAAVAVRAQLGAITEYVSFYFDEGRRIWSHSLSRPTRVSSAARSDAVSAT